MLVSVVNNEMEGLTNCNILILREALSFVGAGAAILPQQIGAEFSVGEDLAIGNPFIAGRAFKTLTKEGPPYLQKELCLGQCSARPLYAPWR